MLGPLPSVGFADWPTDLIIVLQDGQVAEQGTHEQLVAMDGGVYNRLWVAQLSESTQTKDDAKEAEDVVVETRAR